MYVAMSHHLVVRDVFEDRMLDAEDRLLQGQVQDISRSRSDYLKLKDVTFKGQSQTASRLRTDCFKVKDMTFHGQGQTASRSST